MPDWRLQLIGDKTDLEQLAERFSHGANRVWKDADGTYRLHSDEVDDIDDARDVRERLTVVLVTLNGLAKMRDLSQRPVAGGNLIRVGEDGETKATFVEMPPARIRVRAAFHALATTADGETIEFRGDEETQQLVVLAAGDDDVTRVLSHLAGDENWLTLSYVYEIVLRDVGGQRSKAAKKGWGTAQQLSDFWDTACWYKTPGGRHAVRKPKMKPPTNPMSLSDAKSVI